MSDPKRMGMLDDTNILRGAGIDGATPTERLRSSRRMAVVALVCSLLWGVGVLSLVGGFLGFGSWTYLRTHDDRAAYRWTAVAALVLGVLGLLVAVVVFATG